MAKRKIKYFCFYDLPRFDKYSRYFCAASNSKIEYITKKLRELDYEVEIISPTVLTDRNYPFLFSNGRIRQISIGVSLRTFSSISSKFRFIRLLGYLVTRISFLIYALNNIKKGETIIVYHSLGYINEIDFITKVKEANTILEVEEIYADVVCKPFYRKKEIEFINRATHYIFPTSLLNESINTQSKKSIIIHGSYNSDIIVNARNRDINDRIRVVYAGTLDPRKGCLEAVRSMEFLSTNFHLYVLGFGTESEKNILLNEIQKVNSKGNGSASFEGLKLSEEYTTFLTNCDIGISPQDPNSSFNSTSFPSKILSYLSHGLKVVSIHIRSIKESSVGDLITYYQNQNPQEIADAIRSTEINSKLDSTSRIFALDQKLSQDLSDLLS